MCGRISIAVSMDLLTVRFGVEPPQEEFQPRYNAAPMQRLPVILDSAPKQISMARWGFVPHWSKDEDIGSRLINARSETITEKPAFRDSFKNRRCLVLADGFYEWQIVKERKIPYRFVMKNKEPFALAGLWDVHDDVITFTIVTTQPNEIMKPIHNRMPVILNRDSENEWIKKIDSSQLVDMMVPFSSNEMSYYMVSDKVNNPKNDTPNVINPSAQRTLF
ncbi:SOS response-associated peptidase [Candidatus Woesearchaeota archaeon]|nr:SOS response-associated peptidase [Candidatus Woesearchaeota archaeon]